MSWLVLADRVLEGSPPSPQEALDILRSTDDELLSLLQAAYNIRRHHHGRDVRIHVLQNAKSGLCPEDCSFCSQSLSAGTGVDRYAMQSVDELVESARKAYAMGASTYCMVTSTRGPGAGELKTVCEAARRIKSELSVNLKICASLGMLKPGQAEELAAAGVDRFNHNLETSRRFFPEVVTTHDYEDRISTVRAAKKAGMEACCGGIMGMGEGHEDRVAMAFELRELEVESIPLNFLDARPGTGMGDREQMAPSEALRSLAMFRFVNPLADIRVAGGREVVLKKMQALALYPATSIFAQGYLTTDGQGVDQDVSMIEQAGFRVSEILPA